MKKLLFFFFTLTVSGYTYSQVTSFNNLPISRVLIFNMNSRQNLNSALTVPAGKLWFIQQINTPNSLVGELGDESINFVEGAVFPEGTKVYTGIDIYRPINIIEYDLDAQTTALNTNDIKLDNKI